MDSTNTPRFEAMTTGVLLDRAFRLYGGNFSLMLGITAAAYVPYYAAMLERREEPSLRFSPRFCSSFCGPAWLCR